MMTKDVLAFGVLACFVATPCYAQTNPMCAAAGEAAKWAPEQDAFRRRHPGFRPANDGAALPAAA